MRDSAYIAKIDKTKWTTPTQMDDPDMPPAIIVDLDQTLAIHSLRDPMEFSKIPTDLFNYKLWELIEPLPYHIIFLSARSNTPLCRELTLKWIQDYTGIISPHLILRLQHDYRPDFEVKKELYTDLIKNFYSIIAVFDDRDEVVDMWRNQGLFTLHTNYGGH